MSEETVLTFKNLIRYSKNKLEVKKKIDSNLDEKLIKEFQDDQAGDMAVMEATEIEEYVSAQEFMNWDPRPLIGRKYDKTEDNSKMHGQPDSNLDDSFSLLDRSEFEDTSDDLFLTSTPKHPDKSYIIHRREEAVSEKDVNEETTDPPVKNSKDGGDDPHIPCWSFHQLQRRNKETSRV